MGVDLLLGTIELARENDTLGAGVRAVTGDVGGAGRSNSEFSCRTLSIEQMCESQLLTLKLPLRPIPPGALD